MTTNSTDAEILTVIYEERKGRFPSSSPEVRKSVQARLDRELAELLATLD